MAIPAGWEDRPALAAVLASHAAPPRRRAQVPRSARQLGLGAPAGFPSPLRAQAGRQGGHEAKPQTPVSCLPAPPAPLPLSPPRTPEVELRAPGRRAGGAGEGRERRANRKRGSARGRPRKLGPCGLPSRKWAVEEDKSWGRVRFGSFCVHRVWELCAVLCPGAGRVFVSSVKEPVLFETRPSVAPDGCLVRGHRRKPVSPGSLLRR